MKLNLSVFLLLFGIIILGSSCKRKRQIQRPSADSTVVVPTENKLNFLLDNMRAQLFEYDGISAKIKSEYTAKDGDNMSLSINMRAKKNQFIWVSISPGLGLEAARVLFTPDTIKVMDRLNKKYLITDYSFINGYTSAPVNFSMLQNVLTGNPAFIDLSNVKIISDTLPSFTFIHTGINNLDHFMLVNRKFKNEKSELIEKTKNQKVIISYGDYQLIDTSWFPFDADIEMIGEKTVKMQLRYQNIVRQNDVEPSFNIPANYSQMEKR